MPDMRFAPPPAMRVPDKGGGLNQTSVRTYNERHVMSLLRQHEALSRMELGQLSGLSAQTVSVIVRGLQRDNLILAGEAKRGRVGPPSTPMSLNPEGAFAIGIKVGAKSTDMVLIDFVGDVRQHLHHHYTAPEPTEILKTIEENLKTITEELPQDRQDRIVGIGIALPLDIDAWPSANADTWSSLDFEAEIGRFCDLPIYIQNDVTAAAGAELIFGAARNIDDCVYFFVGSTTDSRLVLNHHIYAGRKGVTNADTVSLTSFEARLNAVNTDPMPMWNTPAKWPDFGDPLDRWITDMAQSLAQAIISICSFVDIDIIMLGGRFPDDVRDRLGAEVTAILSEKAMMGSEAPALIMGRAGAFAKAVGAAALPFHSRFMVEQVGLAAG